MEMYDYDFLFVLPPFSLTPSGGYQVVFELAWMLEKKGYKSLVVFIEDLYIELFKVTGDIRFYKRYRRKSLKERVFKMLFTKKIVLKFMETLKLSGFVGFNINTNALKYLEHFDWVISKKIPQIKSKRIVATAWETAFLVENYKQSKYKYYLVQHGEDDPSFSGELSDQARKTYDLNLKKIVTNLQMERRFANEKPIRIEVSLHEVGKILKKPEDREKFICVQLRKGEHKGAIYGIKAIQLIYQIDNTVRFLTYGDYEWKPPAYVVHKKFLPSEEYLSMFNECRLFLLPSLVEGFSTPTLEAMSCGCVPIVTRCGGPEEYIVDGVNGVLVPPKDPDAMANAALQLLRDNNKRIRMAYNAVSVREKYTLENMYNKFINGILEYERSFSSQKT